MVVNATHSYVTVRELLEGPLKGRVCKNTFYRSIATGIVPSVRISPKRILVPSDALDRILAAQAKGDE